MNFSLCLLTCDSQNVLLKILSWLLIHGLWRICLCQRDHLVGFAWVALPLSPPAGVVHIVLGQTHGLLLQEPCCGMEAGRLPGLEGAQPCSACPKQPVHEPEPSAVHFTYILT